VSEKLLLKELETAFNEFDDEKTRRFLDIAFQSIDQFSPNAKKEIYKYAAFWEFQQGNQTKAGNYFWQLVDIDPTYELDPITTSPKLLTLFRKTKIDYFQDVDQRSKNLTLYPPGSSFSWQALFPGWEQFNRGYKTRGTLLTLLGVGSLSGLVYSIVKADQTEQSYLDAADPAQAADLYQNWNTHYKNQYYFGYAVALIWAVSQVDLLLWSTPKVKLAPSASHQNQSLSLQVSWQLN
jgi:hypothetical protein